ncbi:flippase [Bizionia myxarmorum]|uniref:Flippase n=1 Tax=Bizionia myxarmorum TaxID=291186 RepID=A0A5D0RH04_9FLAO|nr:flippase [Bizionia myxarmorum]TYB79814.1 flippase [Bizionia myxarmorum]
MTSVFSKKDFIATKWFTLEKLIQLVIGILIVPKIFSSLGTVDMGKLKLAESVIAMLTPLFFLGLAVVCIREIVYNPKKSTQILATAFYLRLISWMLIFSGLLLYFYLNPNNSITVLYLIIAFSYLFKLTDVFEYYLIAKKWTKYIFISKISTLIIIVVLQYYGIRNQLDVFYFAKLMALDFGIQGLFYFAILKFQGTLKWQEWKFSWPLGKSLLKMSYPLIISNSLIIFYVTIDEIFLKYYHNDHANGIFASVQFLVIALSWNIGFSIITALYPSLAESFNGNRIIYLKKLRQLTFIMVGLGIGIALFYTFLGPLILERYFSEKYAEAKTPLFIFCWAPVFVFIGMIYEKHLLNTNRLNQNIYRFILGCVINVILCIILIPKYDVIGAAIAVLVSHIFTNIIYLFIDSETRKQILYRN